MNSIRHFHRCFCILFALNLSPLSAFAEQINLSPDATATFCQGSFNISSAIDGSITDGVDGWAIMGDVGNSQTAVFKAANNIVHQGNLELVFSLHMIHSNPGHLLGKYRFAVTADSRDDYGQGSECGDPSPGGSATWVVLEPVIATSANGETLTIQPDGSILASGDLPGSDVVTVVTLTSISAITGFRLEALTDSSLPANGPGRNYNGNFVLTEIELHSEDAVFSDGFE